MTFLSPSVLWLLAAVSIPIIIHLLSRLRIKKVEFSWQLTDKVVTELGGSSPFWINCSLCMSIISKKDMSGETSEM